MRSYTPFLKLKANEVAAFFALDSSVRDRICPFFDLPRHKDVTETDFCEMVRKSSKKMRKFFGEERFFYLDCFDISDTVTVAGADKFNFIATEFAGMNFIPVIGLDRATSHNAAVFSAKKNGLIKSKFLAIRLQEDDFTSFQIVLPDLSALWEAGTSAGFSDLILVLDCRICLAADATLLANKIGAFLSAAIAKLPIAFAIVTGSSIPARIGEGHARVGINKHSIPFTIFHDETSSSVSRLHLRTPINRSQQFSRCSLGEGSKWSAARNRPVLKKKNPRRIGGL